MDQSDDYTQTDLTDDYKAQIRLILILLLRNIFLIA